MDKLSFAEEQAAIATELPAFPVQIFEVRRSVKQVLDLFGRNNFFSQYTVHDFSHVEAMLEDLSWIIPNDTKTAMTPADWLMITLAIYFHDLGLIVTEEEFSNRDQSAFQDFCDRVLFAEDDGKDYRGKVQALGAEQAERFYYQEFVRYNHAKRVRAWIEGSPSEHLGYAKAQASEIDALLSRLNREFRSDLAVVCESHNLDDLDDQKKYRPFKPYGRSPQEAANLLYAAVILRTTDLLQITNQRAPSVMFRMINPTDPLSQLEWAKQNAVRGVFPKPATDKEGKADPKLQPHTISVHAKFDNENGFFGLTSYLSYAGKQLEHSYACVQKANANVNNKLSFPWRRIDDTDVEAVGFIPSPFEFNIDQTKILDLLTGHTLYNDSSVAIRELMQNAIDAVRLYHHEKGLDAQNHGSIEISWKSSELILTIRDNGTGMTQDIIERHLLNVGSSRYQDPKFKEANPDFSPISRFGIGVLSTFMVADNVQIVTFHEDKDEGREISLRSVHGKYLIRLLNKHSQEARDIGPHGTKITLRMRSSAERVDVLQTLRRWILFPRCEVVLKLDSEESIKIGFGSPAEALKAYISSTDRLNFKPELISISEYDTEGIRLAFATSYNTHYRDRTFVVNSGNPLRLAEGIIPIGLCVEGVRVEFTSPGFPAGSFELLSVVDCRGKDAPKTNVARTALESETERTRLNELVYNAYMGQVQKEIDRLQKEEGFSLNYAVEQLPFIAGPIRRHVDKVQNEAFKKFSMFLLETEDGRKATSLKELAELGGFWTVESQAMTSLIELLKDASAEISCKQVARVSRFKGAPLPDGNLVTNARSNSIASGLVESEFEICELHGSVADRRLDVRWRPRDFSSRSWLRSADVEREVSNQIPDQYRSYDRMREERQRQQRFTVHGLDSPQMMIGIQEFPISGLTDFVGVFASGITRFLPNTAIARFLVGLATNPDPAMRLQFLIFSDAFVQAVDPRGSARVTSRVEVEYSLKELTARSGETELDSAGFLSAVNESEHRLSVFNPWSWRRAESYGDF